MGYNGHKPPSSVSSPEFIAVQRERVKRGGLRAFNEMAWHLVEPGMPYKQNWHIDAVCEHLEAVSSRQIKRLVINIPPGCMKSYNTSVFWPAWEWTHNPGSRWFYASYDADIPLGLARKSLKILQSDWYKERWGDRVILPKVLADSDFVNSAGGFRYTTSIRGGATGRHPDNHVIDDPTKPLETTKVSLGLVKRWFTETMPTRFRDQTTGTQTIVMQRLHEDDLAGYCIDAGFEVLRLPMRFEPKACSYTKIGGDLRTEEGELLWPGHFPAPELAALEKTLGPQATAAQMQQRPAAEEGLLFKRAWFKTWHKLPKLHKVIQSWDFSFKDLDTSDWVVGQVWGQCGSEFFLLDQLRERLGLAASIKAVEAMSRKWPSARTKLVEDKANGTAVIEALKKKLSGIVAVEPDGGKVARATACTPLFEAGNVYHPDPASVWWVDAHREELANFPVAKNDDTVDATSQALNYLEAKRSQFIAAMAKLREQGLR